MHSVNKCTHQFEASLTLPSYVHTRDFVYNVSSRLGIARGSVDKCIHTNLSQPHID